jgi:hypothetical protein
VASFVVQTNSENSTVFSTPRISWPLSVVALGRADGNCTGPRIK